MYPGLSRREFLHLLGAGAAALSLGSVFTGITGEPAHAKGKPAQGAGIVHGIWPAGPDHDELPRWEDILGHKVALYRERGGVGKLDSRLCKVPTNFAERHGSFNLTSRVGTSTTGIEAVPFAEITAGKWDTVLDAYARDFLALSTLAPTFLEFQSEANIVNPPSQPGPVWLPDGPAAMRYVVNRWRKAGISKERLKIGLSLTRGIYQQGQADSYIKPVLDICDFVGTDGYSSTTTVKGQSFASMFTATATYVRSINKPWAICETGCQEHPTDTTYKARWYDDAGTWLRSLPNKPAWVCWNVSDDGNGGWMPDTSPQALEAFKRVILV